MLVATIIILAAATAAMRRVIGWLDVLYVVSYVKLAVSFTKYMPQASAPTNCHFSTSNTRCRHTTITRGKALLAGLSEIYCSYVIRRSYGDS